MSQSVFYTIITGASHGIGRALAIECAKHGRNLILVALPDDQLESTAHELSAAYPVNVLTFGVDLTRDTAIEELYEWYKEQNAQVDFLINNAGFGVSGYFDEINLDITLKILQLNNIALVKMCHTFIPELKKSPNSYILNLGSMESLLPLPYKTVYTATKKFNYGLSIALREELKPHNISVSLLCPGPVPTHQGSIDRMIAQGWKARIVGKLPKEVAEHAYKKTMQGKNVIIPGIFNAILAKVGAFFPRTLRMNLLEKVARGFLKTKDKAI